MDFLPDNYETPQGAGSYMKLQQGDNKFRILSKPIIGWLDWKDKVPHRFGFKNKPEKPMGDQAIKHFWAMIVFDYADQQIKILEITQSTIQKTIETLAKDEDWGSPAAYDLKINRKGQDKQTEYSVTPSPKKPVSDEIKKAAKDKPVNLEALYANKDPFDVSNGEQTELIFNTLPF
jgi:hypothetical protein